MANELAEVLDAVPRDHARMTVSLLNEKWKSVGDAGSSGPDTRET